MTSVPASGRCTATLPAATGEDDDLHCERLPHGTGRHRDVDLTWRGDDPDSVVAVDELLEADGIVGDHLRVDCCAQASAADLDRLAGWLATAMPGTLRDGERPADTAIRLLSTFGVLAGAATSLIQQIAVPVVASLRANGIDPFPDGITIPPAAKETPL